MKRLLFTSNFKKFIFVLIASIFVLDRLVFLFIFPFYDNWFRVKSTLSDTRILVVGSSHIESNIDLKELAYRTGKSVGLFSLPGAGPYPRYVGIKERLENKNTPPPDLVILEVSRLVFHKDRYFDDEAIPLIPYYHLGHFIDYIDEYGPKHSDWFWRKIFWTYSLNTYYSRWSEPGNIIRFFAQEILSQEEYLKLRRRWRPKPEVCDPTHDSRPLQWREMENLTKSPWLIDEKKVQYVKRTLDLLASRNVKVILLEPPFFQFPGEDLSIYNKIENLLQSFQSAGVRLLRLPIPNNSCFFTDGGHLDFEGQKIFTNELIKVL